VTDPRRKPADATNLDIIASAREVVPILRARSSEINKMRRIPDEVMGLLAEAGLMQLCRPARYGGPEMSPASVFQVARILAEGDGSSAWVYAVTNSHDHLVGMYPQDVQDEYWASDQHLCASSYQPQGKATRVDGGYRLSGKWSFCSGIDHSGWIVVGSLFRQAEAGPPSLLLFMLRKRDLTIVDDWHVMGLVGTGSKTVVAEDIFVPDTYVLDNSDVMAGNVPGAAVHENPLYRTSIWLMFGYAILAPATGILRGAYETTISDSRNKLGNGDPMFAARKPYVQMRLADVGALLDSCDLLYDSSLTETAALIAQGAPVSEFIRTRNRRNQAFIARTCREAMDSLMQLAGGRGIREDAPIQRAARDIFAISAHPGGNWDSAAASFGSVALGGPPTEMLC